MTTNVTITFHLKLAKQATQVRQFVASMKKDLEVMATSFENINKRNKASIDKTTSALKSEKKAISEVSKSVDSLTNSMNKLEKSKGSISFRQPSQFFDVKSQLNDKLAVGRAALARQEAARAEIAALGQGFLESGPIFRRRVPGNAMGEGTMISGPFGDFGKAQAKASASPLMSGLNLVGGLQLGKLSKDALELQQKLKGIGPSLKKGFTDANAEILQTVALVGHMRASMVNAAKAATLFGKAVDFLRAAFQRLQGALIYGAFLVLIATIAAVVKEFVEFDKQLRLANTLLNETEEGLKKVSSKITELSRILPKSASEIAEGLKDIASSFRGTTEEQLKLLKVATYLATATDSTVKDAVDALTTVMNSYNYSVDQAASVSDVLFKTIDDGKVTMHELAIELGKVTPLAAQAGIDFYEVSAAMSHLTAKGNPAARSATSIARVISNIIKPSNAGLKQLNVLLQGTGRTLDAQTLAAEGLVGTMENLNIAIANYIQQQKALSQGSTTFTPITDIEQALKLIDENLGLTEKGLASIVTDEENLAKTQGLLGSGFRDLRIELNNIKNATGSTRKAADEYNKSLKAQAQIINNKLMGSFKPLINLIGTVLVAIFAVLADVLQSILAPINAIIAHLVNVTKLLIGDNGLKIGLDIVNVLLAGFGAIMTGIGLVINGLISVIALLALVVKISLVGAFKLLINVIEHVMSALAKFAVWALEKLQPALDGVAGSVIDGVNLLIDGYNEVIKLSNKLTGQDLELNVIPRFNKKEVFGEKGFTQGLIDTLKPYIKNTSFIDDHMAIVSDAVKEFLDGVKHLFFSTIDTSMTEFMQIGSVENIRTMFKSEVDDISGTANDLDVIRQEIVTALNEMIEQASNAASAMKSGAEPWMENFEKFSLALSNMNYSANELSGMMMQIRNLNIQFAALELLGSLIELSKATHGIMSSQTTLLQTAWLTMAESVQLGAKGFLDAILAFEDPSKLAEIFAKQNYISQSVNQNVVIAPYIQISGAEDEESVMKTVDKALTQWAANNGLYFPGGR